MSGPYPPAPRRAAPTAAGGHRAVAAARSPDMVSPETRIPLRRGISRLGRCFPPAGRARPPPPRQRLSSLRLRATGPRRPLPLFVCERGRERARAGPRHGAERGSEQRESRPAGRAGGRAGAPPRGGRKVG